MIHQMKTTNYKSPYENLWNMAQAKTALIIGIAIILVTLPFTGSIERDSEIVETPDLSHLPFVQSRTLPEIETPWWERTVDIYLDYDREPNLEDVLVLEGLKLKVTSIFSAVDAIGLVDVPISMLPSFVDLDGVVMIEERLPIIFYSDVATPNVKAKESEEYSPETAWELGYFGVGQNIAVIDTGIDNEHPSLSGKFLGGVDFTKPESPLTPRDGSYDPDDIQGHGSTCAGIATGTGAPDGVYQGVATSTMLVDIRIGTKIGGGWGEAPYGQDIYDTALQGIEWAIAHKDDNWPGAGEDNKGIDIISLSWGIYLEEGSSDGSDIYSRMNDAAVEAGIIVANAAGNEGPSNDGLDGLSASSLAVIVGATNDLDTITREDDEIASYSSRGPRKDNNDGNPYDELKPDVSSPGTNINNVEPDTSGSPFSDASGNGYEGRGSGTSYATPNVAGVIAVMLEANPDLTPELVMEILHFTAERRGNGTYPELDPFWNRDFGYGIADAYKAVRVSEAIEDVTEIDPNLQCFIMNITDPSSRYVTVSGISWSKNGEVESVEVRVDGGSWKEVKDETDGNWSKWSYTVDLAKLGKGNHTFEARAVSGDQHSLYYEEVVLVEKSWSTPGSGGSCLPAIGIIAVIGVVAAYFILKRGGKKPQPNTPVNQEPIEPAEPQGN
jgi:subtilisin family serine protease